MAAPFKVTIHMVSSLDGFVASEDNSVAWMHSKDEYEEGVVLTEEYITQFLQSIDCYVMGSRTYERALDLAWIYGDIPVYVLTHRSFESNRENVNFFSGNLAELTDLLKSNYSNIWVVGGPEVTSSFLDSAMADEIVITLVPTLIGSGKRFFEGFNGKLDLHLKDTVTFSDGMVELTYEIKK